ncbi:MAG: glutamine-hydrolyzing carbamoyl-phosphate synthase small subunit [Pseudomonadota bacterium]|nr:glutamine-hydrolyzing carbamoyl-phosphate synthase small subunit [Pseudomonadota bacterium]
MSVSALLVLEDGSVFFGRSLGAAGISAGEVVFNTAMTGYQEVLTDASYHRQIVTLTYPHIGNVGVNAADAESDGIKVAGLVIRDASQIVSNWRAEQSISDYLAAQNVVAIAEIDTRRLTRLLRQKGALRGAIVAGESSRTDQAREAGLAAARAFPGLLGLDLAREVSTPSAFVWEEPTLSLDPEPRDPVSDRFHVVAYDFGIKRNILRLLVDEGCRVTVVPATTPAADVLAMAPDGVFLSNGPGDPEPCSYAISAIQTLLERQVPLFGICLGHQLLGLASGARTVKMKFGHHGANHPVMDLDAGRVLITSQNHGFALDESSLPAHLRATHRSLFDGTLQGVMRTDRPAFGFQGHPEASPGPHDVRPLFARFTEMMERQRVA